MPLFSFILMSTNSRFPYCAMALYTVCLLAESYETINQRKITSDSRLSWSSRNRSAWSSTIVHNKSRNKTFKFNAVHSLASYLKEMHKNASNLENSNVSHLKNYLSEAWIGDLKKTCSKITSMDFGGYREPRAEPPHQISGRLMRWLPDALSAEATSHETAHRNVVT